MSKGTKDSYKIPKRPLLEIESDAESNTAATSRDSSPSEKGSKRRRSPSPTLDQLLDAQQKSIENSSTTSTERAETTTIDMKKLFGGSLAKRKKDIYSREELKRTYGKQNLGVSPKSKKSNSFGR